MRIKRALSSLDVAVLTKELGAVLLGSRVDNVFQLSGDSLLLKLILRDGRHAFLVVEAGLRVCLTTHFISGSSSGRVVLFRRYLRGCTVTEVSQYAFERIMVLGLRGREGYLRLTAELLPRGVIVLTDPTGRILISTTDLKTKDRMIRPGVQYEYPPAFPDVRLVSSEEFATKVRDEEGDLGRVLVRVFGIPPEVVNEVLEESIRARSSRSLSTEELRFVQESLKSFISTVIENPKPIIVSCDGDYVSFHPFIPRKLGEGCNIHYFNTFNEAVDEFFVKVGREASDEVGERSRVEITLSKARAEYEKLLKTYSELSEALRLVQENYALLEGVWLCVSSKVRGEGWGAVASCGIAGYDASTGVYRVDLEGKILNFTVVKDFKTQYFELVKELKSLESKLGRTKQSLEALEARLREAELRVEGRLRKKPLVRRFQWYHVFRWVVTRNGFLAIGGRDAGQNEKIIRKFLREGDIFMHADIHGAPVFLVFTGGAEPSEEDLLDVASLAASYSKAWRESLPSVDVFWVKGSQVSTAAPPGQYLPRGSFMIYGKKNFIKGVRLRISVGLQVIDGRYYEIVVGPAELLRGRCVVLITLEPGDESPSKVAAEFIELIEKTDYLVEDLRVDEVVKHVPGPSKIVEVTTSKL
ncbi:MAG: ribosome rescue protein RqcH [Zestosphaera sp.]